MPSHHQLYPLRFEPIYQYRMWGGRRLEVVMDATLPEGPVGEAWVLSDRTDFPSRIADGPLSGKSIGEVIDGDPAAIFGNQRTSFSHYPLLLKFLDAREVLSVQVHPSDAHQALLPPGERGKTEAWVVLESGPASCIYSGLNPGTTAEGLRKALVSGDVDGDLASFHPEVGDGVFLQAGTVHALGGDLVVFEVQQNSDVTFRLFDWNRVDAKTGKPRDLHIEQGLACIDFERGPVSPQKPTVVSESPVLRELLFDCEFFTVERLTGRQAFSVGCNDAVRTLVCLDGAGTIHHNGETHPVGKGQVWMLPASVGICAFLPDGEVSLLEIGLPG